MKFVVGECQAFVFFTVNSVNRSSSHTTHGCFKFKKRQLDHYLIYLGFLKVLFLLDLSQLLGLWRLRFIKNFEIDFSASDDLMFPETNNKTHLKIGRNCPKRKLDRIPSIHFQVFLQFLQPSSNASPGTSNSVTASLGHCFLRKLQLADGQTKRGCVEDEPWILLVKWQS